MLVRMYRNWSPHTLPVGMSNGGGILENSLLILNWLNIVLSCDPAITLLGIYGCPDKNGYTNVCPDKNGYTNIHSCISHNSKR